MCLALRAAVGALLFLSPLAYAKGVHHSHHLVHAHAHRTRHHAHPTGTPKVGVASWYAHGSRMANGQRFSPSRYTAASRTLPLGTHLRVTNLKTGRSAFVTVTDRGPWVRSRILDLAQLPAREIGCLGTCRIRYTIVGEGPLNSSASG